MCLCQSHEDQDRVRNSILWSSWGKRSFDRFLFLIGSEATMFDGAALLLPALHHKIDSAAFPILGKIMSHGYLACGFLPLRIAFPVIASILLGPLVVLPDAIILESFIDYLVDYEGQTLRRALQDVALIPSLSEKLVSILSRHGCLEVPKPDNRKAIVTEVAQCKFTTKVLGATYAMNSGLSKDDKCFWAQHSVADLYSVYKSLEVSHEKVIDQIVEPAEMNAAQNRVFGFFCNTLEIFLAG